MGSGCPTGDNRRQTATNGDKRLSVKLQKGNECVRPWVAANRIEYYVSILFLIAFIIVRNLGYGWSLVGLYMVWWC